MGLKVDIFTRSKDPSLPTVVDHGENVRAVHLRAGPQRRINRYRLGSYLNEFIDEFRWFLSAQQRPYEILHGHYWLSGIVAAYLSREMKVPMVQNFHSIGLLKNIALKRKFGKEGADPVVYTLGAREHTLKIKQREDGTQIDRIIITSDMAFVPD